MDHELRASGVHKLLAQLQCVLVRASTNRNHSKGSKRISNKCTTNRRSELRTEQVAERAEERRHRSSRTDENSEGDMPTPHSHAQAHTCAKKYRAVRFIQSQRNTPAALSAIGAPEHAHKRTPIPFALLYSAIPNARTLHPSHRLHRHQTHSHTQLYHIQTRRPQRAQRRNFTEQVTFAAIRSPTTLPLVHMSFSSKRRTARLDACRRRATLTYCTVYVCVYNPAFARVVTQRASLSRFSAACRQTPSLAHWSVAHAVRGHDVSAPRARCVAAPANFNWNTRACLFF